MHKVLKKTIATLAMLSLIGSAIPMSASAVTYDRCDVNHDGVVNATDSLTIQRYLQGLTSGANYNQLDADCNLIVDYNDVQCVNCKVLGKNYSAKFYSRKSGELPLPTIPANPTLSKDSQNRESRQYRKYSYATGKESSYSLTSSTESINTRSVIETDDRQPANGLDENTGIVRLESNTGAIGTGFIVGDHVIATAAHCVYSGTYGEFHESTTIKTYGKNGELTGKTLTAVEAHITEGFATKLEPRYDYALITVKENLSDYFQFELGAAYDTNPISFANIPIYVTGRPGGIDDNPNKMLYTAEGRVSGSSNTVLWYNTDTSEGQSGAPVYTIVRSKVGSVNTDTATVLAIHNARGNKGSLITNQHIMFYRNNPNISY